MEASIVSTVPVVEIFSSLQGERCGEGHEVRPLRGQVPCFSIVAAYIEAIVLSQATGLQ